MIVTFKRHTDSDSGLDLYNITVDGYPVRDDIDPWTFKILLDILTRLGIFYEVI